MAARELSLSNERDIEKAANANMLALRFPPVVDAPEVVAALEQVRFEYRDKAAQFGKSGLFYAWCDEVSATIRCSFCEVGSFGELPFRCSLIRADSLAQIAALATAHPVDDVPWPELVDVEFSDPDDTSAVELLVFVEVLGLE